MIAESLRVRIDCEGARADVLLSRHCTIAELLPELLDVFAGSLASRDDSDQRIPSWRIRLADGSYAPAESSLIDAGVRQGDRLTIIDDPGVAPSPLITDVADTLSLDNPGIGLADGAAGRTTSILATLPVAWAIAVAATTSALTPLAASVVGLLCAIAGLRIALRRSTHATTVLTLVAQSLIATITVGFVASGAPFAAQSVTGAFADWRCLGSVAVSLLAASISLLVLQPSKQHFAGIVHTCGAISLALAIGSGSYALLLATTKNHPTSATTIMALTLLFILVSPRLAIVLSGIKVPRIPAAGESFAAHDDAPTQSRDTVTSRAARSGYVLDGFIIGFTLVLVVSTTVALLGSGTSAPGSATKPWAALATFVIACVALIQSRGHARRLPAGALTVGGGLLIAVLAVYLWQGRAWFGAIVLVIPLLLATALGAIPSLSISPTTRRIFEIIEALAIAISFPLLAAAAGVPGMIQGLMS